LWFMLSGAEVAQIGRAPDSTTGIVGGEAEDRVVASSSPALGTTLLFWNMCTNPIYYFLHYTQIVKSSFYMIIRKNHTGTIVIFLAISRFSLDKIKSLAILTSCL
jgi:hypothetical protein